MPTIEITDLDFARLQKIAVPFVDTPATVFTRVMDAFESLAARRPSAPNQAPDVTIYFHDTLPPLAHTKFLSGAFDGVQPDKMTWDAILRLALVAAMKQVGSIAELRRVSGANVVSGQKSDDGYKFVTGNGFSYQGVSAEDAVKIVFRCARSLKVDFTAEFEWRSKDEAYRPGERGRLEYRAA
ncbi:T4SS efffector SepA family protein [Pararhodobacter aggregans]|uniref:Uncharacterized protein n=1 Tax=Pararhodobacter aggregans TaxID=404875 RepID=A0A2T7UL59_9RHOB|nr:hypothetical protein [Pararhodobacter aggregans]PTX05347.1 hypothetical protein C8N33_101766 [Pararhodobacter aggregans]PVE45407.1 hypothetical protein DDE23_21695 [Pararhodobacter aggregans]